MVPADSPTELAQPRVADPEVMTHLVNDRPPNLLDDLGIAVAHRADGTPVDRDPVRQDAGVERRPTRQRHSLVEPQQAGRATVVLHRDGHVAHELAPLTITSNRSGSTSTMQQVSNPTPYPPR